MPSRSTDFPLSVQYFCVDNTVVQKYLVRYPEDTGSGYRVKLDKLPLAQGVVIRTPDFTDDLPYNECGQGSEPLRIMKVSKHNMLVARKIPSEMASSSKSSAVVVALAISPFINNKPVAIDDEFCITIENEDRQTQLEIAITYKLQVLSQHQMGLLDVMQALISADPEESDGNAKTVRKSSVSLINDAFSKTNTPSALFAQSTLTREEHAQLTKSSSSSPTTAEGEHGRQNQRSTSGLHNFFWSAREALEKLRAFSEDTAFSRIPFSRDRHLDFIFRRNLEHILSVCSIPIGDGKIAITCGDISGHRVGPRASL